MSVCDREGLMLAIVREGRWTELCEPDVAEHLETCDACTELVTVASAVTGDHRAMMRDAVVPPSGLVWWRLQRRNDQEAVRTATQAVYAVQALSIIGALAVGVAILGALGDWRSWLKAIPHAFSVNGIALPTAASLTQWSVPLALALVACMALAPVAIYFAIERD